LLPRRIGAANINSARGETMIIYLSLLICIVGALMYALSANPKLVEMGRLAFVAGLLAFLLVVERLVPIVATR
jgi:hypothetical protein